VLPPPQSVELHNSITAYLTYVVNVELPGMAEGRFDVATAQKLGEIWLTLARRAHPDSTVRAAR
jgi:hypothetical protein